VSLHARDKTVPLLTARGLEGSDTPVGVTARAPAYTLVQLVARESFEELIEAQVLEPMMHQASTQGENRPERVAVALLEPMRVALRPAFRNRVRTLRARCPALSILVLPFMSRLGRETNARLFARRIRRISKGSAVVLHCRGESAVDWGNAIARYLRSAAVIADIRGIWPDEMLLARGFNRFEEADAQSRRDYRVALGRLQTALGQAHGVLAVSDALAEWLKRRTVWPREITRVPCCVSSVEFSAAEREAQRDRLGLRDHLVLAYLGGLAPYQHIEDGVVPFVRIAIEANERVHFLCLTNGPERMQSILDAGRIPRDACTVLRVAQTNVARYLAAADGGLLLRAPSEVNRVSMPVKVGEYLSSGVPLIVSRVTGWVDDIVEAHGAGIVVDWFGSDPQRQVREVVRVCHELRSRGDALRRGALALCAERFLWANYTESLRDAYARALGAATVESRADSPTPSR
jgi:glycosyltransferase involved in cell wall biosynthesis